MHFPFPVAPAPPVIVTLERYGSAGTSANVTWTAQDNEGSNIVRYSITYERLYTAGSTNQRTTHKVPANTTLSSTTKTIRDLSSSVAYKFIVTSYNSDRIGTQSNPRILERKGNTQIQ